MRIRILLLLGFCAWTAASSDASYDSLASRSDLLVLGRVVQTAAPGFTPHGSSATTVAVERLMRGLEPVGALTFDDGAGGWRVGEVSLFFLERRGSSGPRFRSIATREESLAASGALARPIEVAPFCALQGSVAQEIEAAPLSLPGLAAGGFAAASIVWLARRRRALGAGGRLP